MSRIHQERQKIIIKKQRKLSKFMNCRTALPQQSQNNQQSQFNQQILGQHHSADLKNIISFMNNSKIHHKKPSQNQKPFNSYSSLIETIDKARPESNSNNLHKSYNFIELNYNELKNTKNSHHFLASSLNKSLPKTAKSRMILIQGSKMLASQKNLNKDDLISNINKQISTNKIIKRKQKRFITEIDHTKMQNKNQLYNFKVPSSKIMIKEGVRQFSLILNRQSLRYNKDSIYGKQLSQIRKKIDKGLLSRFRKVEY